MLRRLLLAAALTFGAAAAPAAEPDRIDRLFADYMRRENIPGAVLVALRGDDAALVRAWGVSDVADGTAMTAAHVQPIYSVSKQFTAALILQLAGEGRIDLDAPLGLYLPEWFADEPGLAVRHLLDHTSGLADFVRVPEALALERAAPGTGTLDGMAALIDRLPRRFAPGVRHAYSNSNFTLLALVAERVSGQRFADVQRERLLRPLGLSGIDECADLDRGLIGPGHDGEGALWQLPRNPGPSYSGNGGLCADALSLARWTRALGAGRGGPASDPGRPPYADGLSMLPLAGRPAFSHAGAGDGWGAWAAYLPEEELTVVILVNRGWFWATDLGVPVVRMLVGLEPPPPLRRLRLTRAEQRALTGDFEDGLFDFRLTAGADRLVLANPAFGEPIELWKQPDGRFVAPARPDTFALRLVGGRPEFDWMEHRSYLVRRSPASR